MRLFFVLLAVLLTVTLSFAQAPNELGNGEIVMSPFVKEVNVPKVDSYTCSKIWSVYYTPEKQGVNFRDGLNIDCTGNEPRLELAKVALAYDILCCVHWVGVTPDGKLQYDSFSCRY